MSEINLSTQGSQFKINEKIKEDIPNYEYYNTEDGKQIAVYTGPLKNDKGTEIIPQAFIKDSFGEFKYMDFNDAKYAIENFHNQGNQAEHGADDLVLREAVDDYEYFESKTGDDYALYRPRTRDDGTRVNGGAFKKNDNGSWQRIDYENLKSRVEDFYSLDIMTEPDPEEPVMQPELPKEIKPQESNPINKAVMDLFDDVPEIIEPEIAEVDKQASEKLISKKTQSLGETDFYELSDGSKLSYNTKGSYAYKQENGSTEWKKINSDELKKYASELENYQEPIATKAAPVQTPVDSKPLPTGEEKKVLFWFTAGYCVPCQTMQNNGTKAKLEAKYNVVTIDITQQPEIAKKFNINRIPTFVAINDKGDQVAQFTGFTTLPLLESLAKKAGAEKKD